MNTYKLTIKKHKVLERLKSNTLEHIECFISEKGDYLEYHSDIYNHLYLILKFFLELSHNNNYSFDECEKIKEKLMEIFCYSKLGFTEQNAFIDLIKSYKSNNKKLSRKSTMLLITNKGGGDDLYSTGKHSREGFMVQRQRSGDPKENESKFSGYESIQTPKESCRFEDNSFLTDNSNQVKIKAYFAFFGIFSENTLYVYKNSKQELLYETVFKCNNLEGIKEILYEETKLSLKEKVILLHFLRTFCFLEHLDEFEFLNNEKVLTNKEYKQMIYKGMVGINGIVTKNLENSGKLIEEQLDEEIEEDKLNKKLALIENAQEIMSFYINEIEEIHTIINSQANTQKKKEEITFKEYLKELIFGAKTIADFFYFSKNIVSKHLFRLYSLTKQILFQSDTIISYFTKEPHEHDVRNIIKEITSLKFNMYDKEALYKIISEELNYILDKTKLRETSSLSKYLDVFDNMSEANFTPFSLIEIYDYEYFYEEKSKEENEQMSQDKIQKKLLTMSNFYLNQFINITNTNFYSVITNLQNESIRIDYRKKIVDYFICFLTTDENEKTFTKMEMLFLLVDKLLFYDGDESQSKFSKMKKTNFFFQYINGLIHKYINLTIISARNVNAFSTSVKMISITKLIIQFLQLLGEGFNLDYHDNIFIVRKGNEDESFTESYYDSTEEEGENEDEEDEEEEESEKKETERSIKSIQISSRNSDLSLYDTMIRNLKISFVTMEISQRINSELPYDKLMVLTTNLIDFLIEYIDTTDDKCYYIQTGIKNLFFGNKKSKTVDPIGSIFLLHSILFTRIDEPSFELRKKIICYVKIKYVQLLIAFLQTGKQNSFVVELIRKKCTPLELFQELLFNFYELIMNIKAKNNELYRYLIKIQNDESFVDQLVNIYMYETLFTEMIEFSLCTKLYILIRAFEEIYGQNMLRNHFTKMINLIKEKKLILKWGDFEKGENKLDLYSSFALRIFLFMEKCSLFFFNFNDVIFVSHIAIF